jgi:hypothetical protein
VLTIGVPQPVPGSDWGCPLQITGLNTSWRRPRYVFAIDSKIASKRSEREALKFWKGVERAHKAKLSSKLKVQQRTKSAGKT